MNRNEASKMVHSLESLTADITETVGFIGSAVRSNNDTLLIHELVRLEKLVCDVSRRVAAGRLGSELHKMRDGVLERVY